MTKLFISYAHQDKELVSPFARELQELGFDVWIDTQSIVGGAMWGTEIIKAIKGCDLFLLFISAGSIRSDSVRREVDLAYKNKTRIVPVLLEKTKFPAEWDYQLSGIQWIDTSAPIWKSHLLDALSKLPLESERVEVKKRDEELELLLAADESYYQGQYARAIELYEEVIKLNPHNMRANDYRAKSKAREHSERKIPLAALELYGRAKSYILVQEHEKAISILENAIAIANKSGVPFLEAQEWLDEIRKELERRKRPKIFISYSRDDIATAEEIYIFLKDKRCIPWMDKYDLLPGQKWKLEIGKNIRLSDFFLACLSNNSVSKKGYVQKELKEAISVLEQVPEGQIYIIPVRLEDCIVPDSLTENQWLDWFSPNAKELMLRAIETKKM